jgi:hypothetical protein
MSAGEHSDGCRCQGCCATRFKRIDPASFGKAPVLPANNLWLRGVMPPSSRSDV